VFIHRIESLREAGRGRKFHHFVLLVISWHLQYMHSFQRGARWVDRRTSYEIRTQCTLESETAVVNGFGCELRATLVIRCGEDHENAGAISLGNISQVQPEPWIIILHHFHIDSFDLGNRWTGLCRARPGPIPSWLLC